MADDENDETEASTPMTPGEGKRIELVTETADATRQLIIGSALLAALVIGSPALSDAAYGRGAIEHALGRFALVVIVCLTAGNVLANMIERAPAPASDDADTDAEGDGEGGNEGDGGELRSEFGAGEPGDRADSRS